MEPFVHYNIYFQMAGFVFLAALALICLLRQGLTPSPAPLCTGCSPAP